MSTTVTVRCDRCNVAIADRFVSVFLRENGTLLSRWDLCVECLAAAHTWLGEVREQRERKERIRNDR